MSENKLKLHEEKNATKKMKCGIIMPIASTPEYPTQHWKDVKKILCDAVSELTDFEPKLVSEDVAVGLIHERIVNNIYNDEIVICDVSSKNPNVMFELGLRLAFDKPTIIIKDENTGYTFDAGVIEHLNYPSSLRHQEIMDFKQELAERIKGTFKKSREIGFSPFLKNFGTTIKPSAIEKNEIPVSEYIISTLNEIKEEVQLIKAKQEYRRNYDIKNTNEIDFLVRSTLNKMNSLNKQDAFSKEKIKNIVKAELMNNFKLSEIEMINILSRYNLD